MKRFALLLGVVLAVGPAWAERMCVPDQTEVITSEARCVDQGGISIGLGEEEGAKVACMESRAVQNRCGPDGRLTRLHAYTNWYNKLKKFENACSADGGTFSYQDMNFVEPADETYCLQAVPE